MIETWDMLTSAPIFYVTFGVIVVIYILRRPDMVVTLRDILALLDTNGGHILMLCAFVWLGYKLFQQDATAGGQLITGAWAALLVLLNVRREKPIGGSQVDTTVRADLAGSDLRAAVAAAQSNVAATVAVPGVTVADTQVVHE